MKHCPHAYFAQKGSASLHKKSAKQSFLQGAVIMMAASLVVKVIGAFFQIPLQNLIGGDKSPAFGMFSAAYRIYTAMLVISTVGLPAALSKMVAEATARGREHEVRRIVRVAAGVFVPVGALCSLALFFGAGTFAAWIKSEDSRLAVMAIAPSVLMVAILSVFRGYYQGRSNMAPTAVSQVIEAAGKLFIGLGLAYWAVGRGFDDPAVAALTVLGVTIAAAILVLAPEYLRAFSEYRMLLFGAVMVIMMIYRPQGLISGEKRTYKITNKDKIDSSKSAFDVPATGGQA